MPGQPTLTDLREAVDEAVQGDYRSRDKILLKLVEEVGELVRAFRRPEEAPGVELGDVLFAVVALANREGFNLEASLRASISTHMRLAARNDPRSKKAQS